MLRNHLSRKQWKIVLLTLGLVLILIGLLIPVLCISDLYIDCSSRYINNLDGFALKYDSIWDCFITRSNAGIVLSILAGILPIILGCYLIRNR